MPRMRDRLNASERLNSFEPRSLLKSDDRLMPREFGRESALAEGRVSLLRGVAQARKLGAHAFPLTPMPKPRTAAKASQNRIHPELMRDAIRMEAAMPAAPTQMIPVDSLMLGTSYATERSGVMPSR